MCKLSTAQIQADGEAVGTALDNLATALKAVDPTVAADLTTAGNALITATANWTEGSGVAILEDAENAAIVVLNAIPLTSAYAPLVAIAFTAINLLIANSQTQASQTGNAVADAHILLSKAQTLNTDSPWFGKAQIKHHFMRPPRKDFESAWNTAARPLGVAEITL
ncbi:MAG: hypothetical protein WB608_01390 [Terracidiphilus sp.]